ncbi:hypothetical protein RHGRI_010527 [Rhododendron griersonianum]|uniref:Glycosyltransferase N-terminal domain-containing protein n=1 Tax=Rhododendron griersonianum TaxID=479676 RepID=A0AAV6KIY1_9ERIC|nr:hypothetical protein RHGRI_010527 [Rhododendron griersonianum]
MLEKPPRIGTETCTGDEQEQEGAAINDEQENRSGFETEKIRDGDGKWRHDEQIKELAIGLEQSKQKFIRILRDVDKGDIFAGDAKRVQLPEGYEERVKAFGMVVWDWAPQAEILEHPSTSGFISHCGWNSCSESIAMGVPIAAWPIHLNQLLQLSCLISSSYNIPVLYATTATHLRQVQLRFNSQTHLQNPNIYFHEFPTPPFLSPPPNPNSSSKFPSHLLPSFEASIQLRDPVAALLREISNTATRIVVIHDFYMAYSLEELKGLSTIQGDLTPDVLKFTTLQADFGTIFNSCRSIEGIYLDLLEKEMNSRNKKVWAIGPLNSDTKGDKRKSNSQHRCLEWFDKQAPKSVLYVSFGTTTTMADEQIKELALELEQSKQKLLWILQDADKGDIFYLRSEASSTARRVRGKGVGIWNGDILKVGLAVTTWEQQEQIVTSSTICGVVKMLMASREGEKVRRKVEEIGGAPVPPTRQ